MEREHVRYPWFTSALDGHKYVQTAFGSLRIVRCFTMDDYDDYAQAIYEREI